MPVHRDGLTKRDLKYFEEEIIHEFHIIAEDWMSQIKQLAEGVANLNEKANQMRLELKAEIERNFQPIAQVLSSLNERLGRVHGN